MNNKRILMGAAVLGAAAVAAVAVVASTGTSDASSPAASDGTSAVRAATASYHDSAVAVKDGYGELKDAKGIACIDKTGVGGMGIHYVKGALVGDPAEKAETPELVIYEPQKNGQLRLVAAEYVVLQSAWAKAGNAAPPSLFGQEFHAVAAGNRYGLPAFYELHAWLWKHNPNGMFADYNPTVSCAAS